MKTGLVYYYAMQWKMRAVGTDSWLECKSGYGVSSLKWASPVLGTCGCQGKMECGNEDDSRRRMKHCVGKFIV